MQYSASLTNASGKSITPETIISVSATAALNKLSIESHVKRNTNQPKANTRKQVPKSGRQRALEEAKKVQRRKLEDKSTTATSFWEERLGEFRSEWSLTKRFHKTAKYLDGLSDQDRQVIAAEASIYVCDILASMILEGRRKGDRAAELGLYAMIWANLRQMGNMQLSPDCFATYKAFLALLKMNVPPEAAADMSMKSRKLPFETVLEVSRAELKLPVELVEFQLQNCGPYLERSFDAAPDARVPNFQPDAWQRKVLDAIDADKSLFVVAPTSAGKTFISFYAMKKILQSDNDGTLVYVAPTKALVNQIAAEIQARFSKSYGNDGRSVWAIHTRDCRVNSSQSLG
ncbi:hypothetical protein CDD83_4790 [Cordyceps sp. RAO-2017]|nr:hypothetical protein CDD83_4790 [Cordyceps sp. RAO-2017]